jgi:Arc/MetJ-type ribon-helix-helix transcriptional regulator
MQISFSPDVEDFIRAEVSSGRYSSPEELVRQAMLSFMVMEEDLDEETVAAINEGQAQIDRGEGMDRETFIEKLNKEIGLRLK